MSPQLGRSEIRKVRNHGRLMWKNTGKSARATLSVALCFIAPCPMDPATHRMKNVPCQAVDSLAARLQFGRFDKTMPVNEQDKEIVFEVELSPGAKRIQTWFTLRNGEQIAAYDVDIEPVQIPQDKGIGQ